MALVPDQKFSTFQNGGTPSTGDIIVGLRGGINTKFTWDLPSAVDTITGTANQVLVNASSGVPVSGAVTLTTPQDIGLASSPTFASLTVAGSMGSTALQPATNAGNYANILTNIATTAARTWSLPNATGTISLDAQVQQSLFNFAASTGVDDAFSVTLSPAPAALTDGLLVTMYSGLLANTTSSATLNVNGLGAKPIVTFAGALAPEDIEAGSNYLFVYNATDDNFQLLNPFISTADTFEVQANGYNYALDTGIANAYIANILPDQISSILSGFEVIMSAVNANTGASTLTVNGFTDPILLSNGLALTGGEIIANGIYDFIYSDALSGFVLMNPSIVTKTSGFIYTSVSGTTQALISGGAYVFNNAGATTGTLPTSVSSSIGDTIKIKGRSSAPWIIQANTGQIITNRSVQSSVEGTATSDLGTDSLQLVYVAANEWSIDFANSSLITLA